MSADRGGGGLSSADIFRTRGKEGLQMQTPALFRAKSFGFFESYGVSTRTRGEGCQFFSRLLQTSFMDGP